MKNKAIGIIGGMGPEASEKFYGLLIGYAQKVYGAKLNQDYPEIYLASIPVPDFIADEKQMAVALQMLKTRVKAMNRLPVGMYCMACNTGHLLLDELKKVTDKPFVSLLDELPKYISEAGVKSVGLLASPTTIGSGMYQKVFSESGISTVMPDPVQIRQLGIIIKDTVAGKNIESNSVRIQVMARELINRGAEGIVEGCTEIPILFPKQDLIPAFDTLEILAKAVLKKYYLLK